ncbi:MAG TPA: TIM barrel protein [Pirellulaceae bacterium]|jgi:hydroxypyruvate isomerase|nr:TIM barrel protein [Pirellulaceae bacterium]
MAADPSRGFSRRRLLQSSAVAAAALAATASLSGDEPAPKESPAPEPRARNGRVKQSFVHWCWKEYWDVPTMCAHAKTLGCESVELVPVEHFKTIKENGLTCAIASSHGFVKGMNDPAHHEYCIEKLTASIDACAEYGFPTVITFTGFAKSPDPKPGERTTAIDPEEGIANCVAGFKKIVGYAEKKGVNLSLEMLNSRVDENMKGHPGYQGDHVDYCMQILRQVGSPRLGLLFDIYHVQIMDGDVIRRIGECGEFINHVHTAGNPGRCELDAPQEINYPPIIKALAESGYQGYVGHEFIPTRDPWDGLEKAVRMCDV